MKKVLIATGIAALAFASIASAQSYSFTGNLTVGSTGPAVVALQTMLISNNISIPSIQSGAAAKGYFGTQTKVAVQAYQAARGIPSTGFVGPLTRASLNGGVSAVVPPAGTPVSMGCPTGYVCTPASGTVVPPVVTTPTTPGSITTPGIPGILSVSSGPISSTVFNVGQQMVPVIAVRAQAQYSDMDVQSLTLNLGNNTAVYNKIFNTIYVTDGTNVLASVPVNGSTVVQSGSEYILGIAGFHFIVPKGQHRDLIIKASLNSSIDSAYISTTGTSYPDGSPVAQNSINGTAFNGWGVGVVANGVRAVDGAGLNLYGPTTGYSQTLTINASLVDNAQANISRNASSPLAISVPVTDTTNGQYLGLPVLVFDVNAQNDALHLRSVTARIYTASGGTGSIGAAYLFQGSKQIQSATVSGGLATFSNISNGTDGATIGRDQTLPYTIKVDVTGVTSGSLSITAGVATTTSADLTILSSNDSTATVSGSASGNTQTVASAGPLFTLVGTPTLDKSSTSDTNGIVTTVYTATYNVSVQAIGSDIDFGLTSSSTAAFGTTTTGYNLAQIYKNGAATTTGAVTANYSKPSNTTLSNDGTYFTLSRNQTVTIPVTYAFSIYNPAANTYAVQLQGVQWAKGSAGSANSLTSFMANQPEWRTVAK